MELARYSPSLMLLAINVLLCIGSVCPAHDFDQDYDELFHSDDVSASDDDDVMFKSIPSKKNNVKSNDAEFTEKYKGFVRDVHSGGKTLSQEELDRLPADESFMDTAYAKEQMRNTLTDAEVDKMEGEKKHDMDERDEEMNEQKDDTGEGDEEIDEQDDDIDERDDDMDERDDGMDERDEESEERMPHYEEEGDEYEGEQFDPNDRSSKKLHGSLYKFAHGRNFDGDELDDNSVSDSDKIKEGPGEAVIPPEGLEGWFYTEE